MTFRRTPMKHLDVKLNFLVILVSAAVLFFTLINILHQEYPNEFLLQNLQKKDSTYAIESREHGTLLANITMEEGINSTVFINLISKTQDGKGLRINISLTFNPIGQLFNSHMEMLINDTSTAICQSKGISPLRLKCALSNPNKSMELIVDNPIYLIKKSNGRYLITNFDQFNTSFLAKIYNILSESTFKDSSIDKQESYEFKLNSLFDIP